jgi:hypothetical protein
MSSLSISSFSGCRAFRVACIRERLLAATGRPVSRAAGQPGPPAAQERRPPAGRPQRDPRAPHEPADALRRLPGEQLNMVRPRAARPVQVLDHRGCQRHRPGKTVGERAAGRDAGCYAQSGPPRSADQRRGRQPVRSHRGRTAGRPRRTGPGCRGRGHPGGPARYGRRSHRSSTPGTGTGASGTPGPRPAERLLMYREPCPRGRNGIQAACRRLACPDGRHQQRAQANTASCP